MVPVLLAAAALFQGPQGQRPTITLIDTAVITSERIPESSGLVVSRRYPGRMWTINDSDNEPSLLRLDSTGRDRGRVRVRGARNVDWEDLALGPCPAGNGDCLYIADIGDNDTRRDQVTVYIVPEPLPPTNPSDTLREVAVQDSLVLRYPDVPHDAEAIAITPDRWLLIVTKDRGGPARLYRTSIDSTGGGRRLSLVDEMPIATSVVRGRLVTGAAVSPNGRFLAVRTYVSIHFFRLLPGGATETLLPRAGLVIPVVEAQGEAIAFDGNDALVLTSERQDRHPAIMTRLRVSGLPSP